MYLALQEGVKIVYSLNAGKSLRDRFENPQNLLVCLIGIGMKTFTFSRYAVLCIAPQACPHRSSPDMCLNSLEVSLQESAAEIHRG